MTSREMIEVSTQWNGPLGKWLRETIKEMSEETLAGAVRSIPKDMEQMNEREQNFGRGLALADLLSQIPHKIKDTMKELEKKE